MSTLPYAEKIARQTINGVEIAFVMLEIHVSVTHLQVN